MPEQRAEKMPDIEFVIGYARESRVCGGVDGCGLPVADIKKHLSWHINLERRLIEVENA